MGKKIGAVCVVLSSVVVLNCIVGLASPVGFDVRQHLSTTTRYGAGKEYPGVPTEIPETPAGCAPIHLNLVARHGTRGPTVKRIKQLDRLIANFKNQLLADTKEEAKRPTWLKDFTSPWAGRTYGGELLPEGEKELYDLGQRLRARFPGIFQQKYHPDVYPITATQVARSAASAVAFGMGLFAGEGLLGDSNNRAFSVITDSRDRDIHLRFHESCMKYKESKKLRKPAVQVFQDDVYRQIAPAVGSRYGLNMTLEDAESFWLLCKEEAALLSITDRACGLFNAAEVELLEWTDDVQAHHLKGYGEAINYQMGVPLLEDVVKSMDRAITASEGLQTEGAIEAARLRVAHAETVIPLTCLLGLFMETGDVESLQVEKLKEDLPRPPQQRQWRGARIAPFAANTALVLHKCSKKVEGNEYLVQVLHNEKPVSMPACNGEHFCPFRVFKETVAAPHLKHSFDTVCNVPVIHTTQKPSWTRRLWMKVGNIIQWPFQSSNVRSPDSRTCKAY